ncbi:MAG: imidazoleglycerol-phosphate dehydratase HisB [Spirochaetes bacterium]|nr:MAG: imidazoleglycerol-phosphate dehydratase HisB [Spirochaetota bacterium]
MIEIHRSTKETDILVKLDMNAEGPSKLETGLPFFDHMLNAMSFHGGFRLEVKAAGDIDVDPHHLVEDTGLVIGAALEQARKESSGIRRYGSAVIPMDDALSEAVVDACGRPYLKWNVEWAQLKAGDFDLFLLREFFWGLAVAGKLNLHLTTRYSENGHHAAEALFKAAGRALSEAYTPKDGGEAGMSTKGTM